jgi:hypothetical protein
MLTSSGCVDWLTALIAGMPALIAALGAFVTSVRGNRKVDDVAHAVNGRLNELVSARAQAAFDRGFISGRGVSVPPKPEGGDDG